jgi:hypothetical protein
MHSIETQIVELRWDTSRSEFICLRCHGRQLFAHNLRAEEEMLFDGFLPVCQVAEHMADSDLTRSLLRSFRSNPTQVRGGPSPHHKGHAQAVQNGSLEPADQ